MRSIFILGFLLLVGCGADGAPTAPGVSISGDVAMGISNQ